MASFAPVFSSQSNECSKALWLMQPSGLVRYDRVIEFVFKYVWGRKKCKSLSKMYYCIALSFELFFTIPLLTIFSSSLHYFCTITKVINHSGDVQTTYSIIMANNCSSHCAHKEANTDFPAHSPFRTLFLE